MYVMLSFLDWDFLRFFYNMNFSLLLARHSCRFSMFRKPARLLLCFDFQLLPCGNWFERRKHYSIEKGLLINQNSLRGIKFSSVGPHLAVTILLSISFAVDVHYLESKLELGGVSIRRFGFDFFIRFGNIRFDRILLSIGRTHIWKDSHILVLLWRFLVSTRRW